MIQLCLLERSEQNKEGMGQAVFRRPIPNLS